MTMKHMTAMAVGDIACENYLEDLDAKLFQATLKSQHTLQIPDHAPAIEVARLAEAMHVGLVVVLGQDHRIRGVIAPDWARTRIATIRGKEFGSLAEALEDMAADPMERERGFHHELLTEDRIELYYCSGGHFTAQRPCPLHAK